MVLLVVSAMGKGAGLAADPAPQQNSLVRLAQSGDHSAFEALVIQYERMLLRLAYRMLGNLEEAKDASQEVLVRFHRYLHKLDPERNPSPWLHPMMLNVCRDMQRKRGRAQIVSLDSTVEPHAPVQDPIEGLHLERRSADLVRALASLPPKERAALVLRDVEGRSAAEAARLLGSSEVTVRSQACRGRIRLKKLLEEMS
jgi:RNA polymerase sigma-70 factor, ECF subfamily